MSKLWVAVTIVALSVSGCATMTSPQHAFWKTTNLIKPNPNDYRDVTEEESDEWEIVGREGRGNKSREKDPDGHWWGRWVMSAKARNIEKNLGIDHEW